jgi:hypothetical protein
LVKIIQELDVVRLGEGEILVAGEYRLVVEERPDDRRRGWRGAVLGIPDAPLSRGMTTPKRWNVCAQQKKPALPPAFVSHYSAFSALLRIP